MPPGQRIVRTLSLPLRSLLRLIQRGALLAAITVFVGVLVAQIPEALRTRSEQGDASAQNKLGDMYRWGSRVPKDLLEALKWYRLAAEQGDARAQDRIGDMYSPGNHAEAVKWYRLAAEQGYADAQMSLGFIYYFAGQDVPQDYAEALKWFRLAAERGNARAQDRIGDMYANGEGVPQDYAEAAKWHRKAAEWYRKAAEQGDFSAQIYLGDRYYNGRPGIPKDYAEALNWYRLLAEQGFESALMKLGEMYFNGGPGLPQDYAETVKWYRLAAEQGYSDAQDKLGKMYYNGGPGAPQDYAEAVVHRQQLLAAVFERSHHHQQTLPFIVQTDVRIDAVGPNVNKTLAAEVALRPSLVLAAPDVFETHHRRRRQAWSVGSQQGLQRLAEIARRDSFQVQPRDQFFDAFRAPQVGRQNLGCETKAPALLIDSAIVDPRRLDLQLTRAADNGALAGVTVAHHQPPAVLADFVLMRFDVGGYFGFHGLDEHLARSLAQQFTQGRVLLSIHDLGLDLTAALSSFTLTHGVSSLFLSRKRLN